MAAETCWNLSSENLMSPHLALTLYRHEKCCWSWPQWVQAVRLSVVPGQRSSMQMVIQFCLLFKSLPPWSPVLTLCLSDSCVFNWITICSWGGPFLFRRGMHELIYLPEPDCARYFLFVLTTTPMHFLSFSAWGLILWIPSAGLPFPRSYLFSANAEMGKKGKREVRAFIVLAKLHMRSPVLIKGCPSLCDGLLYVILTPYWFQEVFPPSISSISVW